VSGDDDRAQFLATLERELRVTGRERARILEEIRGHLHEATDDPGAVARFGDAESLAKRFDDLHATRTARRILGRLAFVGSFVGVSYVAGVVLAWTVGISRTYRRLTPPVYADIDADAVAALFITLSFVAVTLALGAFTLALGSAALRRRAAVGLAAIVGTALPPSLAIAYLAATGGAAWMLAPAGVTATAVVGLAVRARDHRASAVTVAILATTAFGSMLFVSILISGLLGFPAPTSAMAIPGYLQLALLPICISTVMGARRARLLSGNATDAPASSSDLTMTRT